MSLEDRVAVVTGGSRGIGAAIVRMFTKAGARVLLNYQKATDQANRLVSECGGTSRCVAVQQDLATAEAARNLIREGATRAMRKIGQIPPYRIEGPVTLQIEYTTRNALPVDIPEGAEMVDARTIRYTGSNFLDVWKRYGEK